MNAVMEELQLRLYNTMSRQKEVFQPLVDEGKADDVLLYSCGPTVYGEQHIGNMRAAYFADIVKRTIKYVCGYSVKHTTNITDVGHLTDDGDTGEDKMEKGSRREGMSAWDIARKYEKIYLDDVASLGIDLADNYPRATDYIVHQIKIVNQLFQKGLTYVIPDDGIYCDTSKIQDYGKLLPEGHLSGLDEGARVDAQAKKNMTDFALWKFSPKYSQRQMEWVFAGERMGKLIVSNSTLQNESIKEVVLEELLTEKERATRGFPGWHVECSAMSWATLGRNLDIHTGGIDHVPVHHTNEIVQSEYSFCQHRPWVKYRMHNQFLNIDAEKVSKSLGNVVCMSDVRKKGIDPLSVRYFFHQAHYRSFQDFTRDGLMAAQRSRINLAKKLQDFGLSKTEQADVLMVKSIYQLIDEDRTQKFVFAVLESLFDDLQIPQVLATVCAQAKSLTPGITRVIFWLDHYVLQLQLFSLDVVDNTVLSDSVPAEVRQLAEQRVVARRNKKRSEADSLRDQIIANGFGIEDKGDDYVIVKNIHEMYIIVLTLHGFSGQKEVARR